MAKTPLKVVTEARSPERQQLAVAVEKHAQAMRQLAAVKAAQEQASDAVYSARDNIEAATAAIETAKVNAGKFLTARMLGERGDAPVSVQEARTQHTVAVDALEAAVAAGEALQVQGRAAEQSLSVATLRRDDALRAVVKSDPATAKLVAAFDRAQREMVNLRRACEWLDGALMIPDKFWRSERDWPELPGASAWKAWVTALEGDPDASIEVGRTL